MNYTVGFQIICKKEPLAEARGYRQVAKPAITEFDFTGQPPSQPYLYLHNTF